jgi:hypothetical protein
VVEGEDSSMMEETNDDQSKRQMFNRSWELQKIEEELPKLMEEKDPNELVRYALISKAVGFNIRDHLAKLASVRNAIMNNTGMEIAIQRGEGVYIANNKDKVNFSERDARSVRKKARKSFRRLTSVAYEKLSTEDRLRHTVESARVVGTLHAGSIKVKNRLQKRAETQRTISLEQTLRAFEDTKEDKDKDEA